jgi:hypothetical protein
MAQLILISRLTACLVALGFFSSASAATCGPIAGTYALKTPFAGDNTVQVIKREQGYEMKVDAAFATEENDGSRTSTGTAQGLFTPKKCLAVVRDEENECRFELVFKGRNTLVVRQLDSCMGFGHNVDASGTYKKQLN